METQQSDSATKPLKIPPKDDSADTKENSREAWTSTSTRKKQARTNYSPEHLRVLNDIFQANRYPSSEYMAQVGAQLGYTEEQIKVWFQNKRAATTGTRQPKRATKSAPPICVPLVAPVHHPYDLNSYRHIQSLALFQAMPNIHTLPPPYGLHGISESSLSCNSSLPGITNSSLPGITNDASSLLPLPPSSVSGLLSGLNDIHIHNFHYMPHPTYEPTPPVPVYNSATSGATSQWGSVPILNISGQPARFSSMVSPYPPPSPAQIMRPASTLYPALPRSSGGYLSPDLNIPPSTSVPVSFNPAPANLPTNPNTPFHHTFGTSLSGKADGGFDPKGQTSCHCAGGPQFPYPQVQGAKASPLDLVATQPLDLSATVSGHALPSATENITGCQEIPEYKALPGVQQSLNCAATLNRASESSNGASSFRFHIEAILPPHHVPPTGT